MPVLPRPRRSEDDEHPRPERVSVARWSRVYVGLLLIAAAIIWSLINSRMGISVPAPAPTPVAPAESRQPALGEAQTAFGRTVNAKLLAVVDRVAGRPAQGGDHYVLIAVQVADHGADFALAPTDFALRSGTRVRAPGRSYPGHAGLPAHTRLQAHAVVTGTLVFEVPAGATAMDLAYTPRDHPGSALLWRVIVPSR